MPMTDTPKFKEGTISSVAAKLKEYDVTIEIAIDAQQYRPDAPDFIAHCRQKADVARDELISDLRQFLYSQGLLS
ncbi:hypothetical protein DXT98_01130 [Agrobacterium sp. ICMP 7243]|nr:hypothetical protein DXT98_01130 [Agrobacterium sp. ICMP 7243]